MLSVKKMYEIIAEKDPKKQRAMIDALSSEEKEKLLKEAKRLHEATKALLDR